MKNYCMLLLIYLLPGLAIGQDAIEKANAAVLSEGNQLYRSEMASWYGTDIFLERFKEQRDQMRGYFSYPDSASYTCIFYSGGDTPKVLATITFDSSYDVQNARVDGTIREFTGKEKDYYNLRLKAFEDINRDTLYKSYKGTNLNLIPTIYKNERKVYVLTGTAENGKVIFGNDYLLTFDQHNQLISRKALHQGIIPVNYGNKEGKEEVATLHTHAPETGDLMTPTDICTLMLYARFTQWMQHLVISKNYVSFWNREKGSLFSLSREAWEKIMKDQQTRHPGKNK